MLLPESEQLLWQRIEAFQIDAPDASYPFSRKLSDQEKWTPSFTTQAIAEYKKFIFLCCILPEGASPSPRVDNVWHLHLTYTKSYWTDFCRDTLGKDIHHHPSNGGISDLKNHRQWYADTLRAYEQVFGKAPPVHIWPAPLKPATDVATPEITIKDPNLRSILIFGVALQAFPVLFNAFMFGEWNPFALSGPHFLGYYVVFCVCVMLPYVLYMRSGNRALSRQAAPAIPGDLNVFQAAAIIEGRHRATQTAILDLLQRELIGMSDAGFHIQPGMDVAPAANEQNPLRRSLHASYPPGSIVDYHCLWELYTANDGFTHRELIALEQVIATQSKNRWLIPCITLIVLVAIIRFVQGVHNERPVEGLLVEACLAIIVFTFLSNHYSKKWAVSESVQEVVQQRLKEDLAVSLGQSATLYRFALEGTPSIANRLNGALLIALLGSFAVTDADATFAGSSSSDHDAGCSNGGDSGGDSGGGGSCGGCSGA